MAVLAEHRLSDLYYAWNEDSVDELDRIMYGYRTASGLDLLYGLLGHIVDKDGCVIGCVMEPSIGRSITPQDRPLVYSTIRRLQDKGILYRAILNNRFAIEGEKLRLTAPSEIYDFNNDWKERFRRLGERYHWKELDQLFFELDNGSPYGNFSTPLFTELDLRTTQTQFCLPPSPEYPIGGISIPAAYFKAFNVDVWPAFLDFIPFRRSEVGRLAIKEMKRRRKTGIANSHHSLEPTDLPVRIDWKTDDSRQSSLKERWAAFWEKYGEVEGGKRYFSLVRPPPIVTKEWTLPEDYPCGLELLADIRSGPPRTLDQKADVGLTVSAARWNRKSWKKTATSVPLRADLVKGGLSKSRKLPSF